MNQQPNTPQPDPAKAITLKPGQQSRRRKRPSKSPQWQPHQSDQALDAWGVALRALKAQGHSY
jgi:hypothetical protein